MSKLQTVFQPILSTTAPRLLRRGELQQLVARMRPKVIQRKPARNLLVRLANADNRLSLSVTDLEARIQYNHFAHYWVVAGVENDEASYLVPLIQHFEDGSCRVQLFEKSVKSVREMPGSAFDSEQYEEVALPLATTRSPIEKCSRLSVSDLLDHRNQGPLRHYSEAVLLATLVEIDLAEEFSLTHRVPAKYPHTLRRAEDKLRCALFCRGYRLIRAGDRVVGYVGIDWIDSPPKWTEDDPTVDSGYSWHQFKDDQMLDVVVTAMRLRPEYRDDGKRYRRLLVEALIDLLTPRDGKPANIESLWIAPKHPHDREWCLELQRDWPADVRSPPEEQRFQIRLLTAESPFPPTSLVRNSSDFARLDEFHRDRVSRSTAVSLPST